MTRFSFNYKTASGVASLVLEKCAETFFKQFKLLGNSVQETTTGKNLFDKDSVKLNFEFTYAPSDVEGEKEGWFVSDFIPVLAGKTYFISGKTTGFGCKMYDKDKRFVKNIQAANGAVLIEDNISYFRINGEIKDLKNIQIELGTKATIYEQYTGGKPSPSPEFPQEIKNVGKWNEEKQKYEVDVQVTGKNLLNLKKCNLTHFPGSNQKGEINDDKIILKGTRYSQFKVKVEKGKKYTLTAKFQSGNNPSIQCWSSYSEDSSNFNDFGRSYGSIIQNSLKEITFTSETDYLCLYFYPGSENEFVTYYELMICEQNLYDKIYEPYREPQTVKLSLDQPLRGIGEHKDEVTKDGVVRKIKQITLNGSEDWTLHNNTSKEKTQSFGLVIPVKCYAANVGLKSNRFLKRYTVWMGDIEGIDIYSGRTLYINIEKTKASNVEEFKKWLSENQVTVEVVLVEPIIEPLAEESKKALESLYTNNGTTVIAVDGGEVEAKIEVEYAVKE